MNAVTATQEVFPRTLRDHLAPAVPHHNAVNTLVRRHYFAPASGAGIESMYKMNLSLLDFLPLFQDVEPR